MKLGLTVIFYLYFAVAEGISSPYGDGTIEAAGDSCDSLTSPILLMLSGADTAGKKQATWFYHHNGN